MTRLMEGAIATTVRLLVDGEYDVLESLSSDCRLTAELMKRAVDEYGRTLTTPPTDAFHNLDAVQVDGAQPPRWSIRFPLWTAEEGESDLALFMTATESSPGLWDIEIDGIYVD
jgi:hypothetical protein